MSRLLIYNIGLLATPCGTAAKAGPAQGEVLLEKDAWILAEDGLIKETGTDSPGWTEYSYSKNGTVQTATFYDENGAVSGTQVTTYDQYGNVLLLETFDASGAETMTMAYSYVSTDGRTSSGIAG